MSRRPGSYLGGNSVVSAARTAGGTGWPTYDDAGVDTTERGPPILTKTRQPKDEAAIYIGAVAIASKKRLPLPAPPKSLSKEIDAAGGPRRWIEAAAGRKRTYEHLYRLATAAPLKKKLPGDTTS